MNRSLSQAEYAELVRVAKGEYDSVAACSAELDLLVAMRLVEASPVTVVPVLPIRYRYQLTPEGARVLKEC